MKKNYFFGVSLLIVFSFISCKKNVTQDRSNTYPEISFVEEKSGNKIIMKFSKNLNGYQKISVRQGSGDLKFSISDNNNIEVPLDSNFQPTQDILLTMDDVVIDIPLPLELKVYDYAGGDDSGYVDGPAKQAKLDQAVSMCVDANNNIYFCDYRNHLIRKISPTGQFSTIAGVHKKGGYKDGNASSALFLHPRGIAVDKAGNVYVGSENRIRKITPNGIVSTYAGIYSGGIPQSIDGTTAVAQFCFITDLFIDADGTLYVAEISKIRKVINGNVRFVTTVAGSTEEGYQDGEASAARFKVPLEILKDSKGNMFILEEYRVRKLSNGVVSTFCGTGTWGYNNGIGTAASFNQAIDMVIDKTDNLYIADYFNHVIRKITPAAVVTTYAGTGVLGHKNGPASKAEFRYLKGLAINSYGKLFVAEGHWIRTVFY